MVGEPAPTRTMYSVIYGWVGAGFRDCRLLTIMVGEPAPTRTMYMMILSGWGRVFEIVDY